MGRRRRVLAVGVPAALLLGVVGVAGLGPGVAGCGGAPEQVLRPTPDRVPDLVGLPESAAQVLAEGARVDWAGREARTAVDAAARGTVLEQSGGGCDEPLRLVMSTGGPLVGAADQAPAARAALGPDPGPVRAVRYGEGLALQSDDVVTGECPAVERLVREEPPGEGVEVGCHPRPVDALVRTVTDGSRFLGPDGDDVRVLQQVSGAAGGEVGWTADRAVDGWRLTVLVGSARGLDGLRCGPASSYEVCEVDVGADGSEVATAQVRGERPPGQPYVAREAVLQDGPWRVRVSLSPDVEGSPGPRQPTEPPAGTADLVMLAGSALRAVEPVSAAP